jgi:hypothetical protein
MTSFIELPMLAFDGRELPSVYVNTADIITFSEQYDGQTALEIRQLGSEACAVTRKTYIPAKALVGALSKLTEEPGVTSWTEGTKELFREPLQARLREAAARERAVR